MGEGKKETRQDRMFRSLLRLFPFEFRSDYGRDMEHTFADQRREAEREGTPGILRLWWETIAGIFRTAPREHWEMLRQDAGFAVRMMRKNPGFTLVVVLTLALGIGANTAIFSVINGVMLRPLPYANGPRVVRLRQMAPLAGIQSAGFSPVELNDYRQMSSTFSEIVEYHSMSFTFFGQGDPQRVVTGVVSANFFQVLGVKPVMGRLFLPGEDQRGAEPVLLLTYSYWKNVMGSDPKIIGKTFQMNDRVHTVVGVLPPLPGYPDTNLIYMPISSCPFRSAPRMDTDRDARMLAAFAKLKPGVTYEQAQADAGRVAAQLAAEYPASYPPGQGFTATVAPLARELTEGARPTLLVLLGASGLVLLLTCANVANLTLSRQLRREHELAVRATLGASPGRVFRQLITESTLLAAAGGAFGLLVAGACMTPLVAFAARFTPLTGDIRIDGIVLGFALGVSILTGLLFGSVPALGTRRGLAKTLNQGVGRATEVAGRHRVRNVLVTAQVAISFVLLIGAGLMLRTLVKLQTVDTGYRTENVLSSLVSLNFTKYAESPARLAFFQRTLELISHKPGVISAAFASPFPLDNQANPWVGSLSVEGHPLPKGAPYPHANLHVVSEDYFQTLGIPLVRGRLFNAGDKEDAQEVVIISESLAKRHWPNRDPIGQRVSTNDGKQWNTVVGVVGDVRQYGLNRPPVDTLYAPLLQNLHMGGVLLVHTTSDPRQMAHTIVAAVHEVDPQQPVVRVRTLDDVHDEWLASPRLTATLVGLFASLALIITLAGISGVTALAVSQRTHEIGIRMALGATRGRVLRMVVGEGLVLVTLGLIFGAGSAPIVTRPMADLLFGVKATDPATYVAVALVVLGVAATACFIPSRRAASVDPLRALRSE
ncbi:MAG TPA: ABC transporter permease [Candidatus Acidoferrales bacterium]|nr:ABC transporter permease [Candidatus Acidoferrales bacterium]